MRPRACLQSFWQSKTLWMSLLIPLAAAPLPYLYPSSVTKCAYCVIVIGLFWVTEILPLPVTSLFPLFMFPMLGIMSAKDVCQSYIKDTLMLFLGSLVVAVAVERWNLHKRLALRTLTLVGPQPRWLMLGIMLPCWFLSMWMSNTATCAMMMPIVSAILEQIRDSRRRRLSEGSTDDHDVRLVMKSGGSNDCNESSAVEIRRERLSPDMGSEDDREFLALARVFMLCTAYAANIGGMATLTGTPPNIIFKGIADDMYKVHEATNPINFANWLVLGMPISFLIFIGCWLWMMMYGQGLRCFRCCTKDDAFASVKRVLREEYRKLGSMSFAESLVLIHFITLAVLWVTRNPGFIPGWGQLFKDGYVKDSTPVILIAVMLFVLPARPPRWMPCFRSKATAVNEALTTSPAYQPILNWQIVNQKLAWGVLLLMGGGFALADGCQVSGLSNWVSKQLQGLGVLPHWVIAILLSLFVAMATEVTSNAATTTIFIPIVGQLAIQVGAHPLYFMLPCAIAASLAFLLPVATPPNAIVFASGYLRVRDMVTAGIPMNIMSLIVLNIGLNAVAAPVFGLFQLPVAFQSNSSVPVFSTSPVLDMATVPNVNYSIAP